MRVPGTQAGDYLRLSARRYPERDCLVFGDGSSRTFAETNCRVNKLADALLRRGLRPGDRVAILATDSGEYVEVILACLKLGLVYVPLNFRLADAEVRTLLARARPRAIFASSRYVPLLDRLAPRLGPVELAVSLDGEQLLPVSSLLTEGRDTEPGIEVADDDILALAFTSGTTGLPKGVRQPQRMLKSLALNMSIDYGIMPDEFRYTASPVFHIAGQAMIFMHVMRGLSTLILPQFAPEPVLSWMQSGHLTGCFLVPTMIRRLLDDPHIADGGFGSLRSIIYGAGPITPALLREAMDVFGCDFINAFGAATEGGLQTSLSAADHRRAAAGAGHLLGSIGRPSFGVELRLVDADGADVPPGQVGEIVTRSDAVMAGYLELPEEDARAFRHGWFWGGDLARMDAEGYLFLAEYPGIAQVAVVGRPDEHWGEAVVAFVTLPPGGSLDTARLRLHCRERLASYKVPRDFEVIGEMPLNASGKIVKRALPVSAAPSQP
jgi:acyl-CoA synthetase (AMP-forming)/AMP-acid ligase II